LSDRKAEEEGGCKGGHPFKGKPYWLFNLRLIKPKFGIAGSALSFTI